MSVHGLVIARIFSGQHALVARTYAMRPGKPHAASPSLPGALTAMVTWTTCSLALPLTSRYLLSAMQSGVGAARRESRYNLVSFCRVPTCLAC